MFWTVYHPTSPQPPIKKLFHKTIVPRTIHYQLQRDDMIAMAYQAKSLASGNAVQELRIAQSRIQLVRSYQSCVN